MASSLSLTCSISAAPIPIRASSSPSGSSSKPNLIPRKPSSPSASVSSASWWVPLFGWSSDADYINNLPAKNPEMADSDPGRPRSRFALGCFTEEKAKQLRRKTMEGSTFHDIMYHSAIASRLASDGSGRADR